METKARVRRVFVGETLGENLETKSAQHAETRRSTETHGLKEQRDKRGEKNIPWFQSNPWLALTQEIYPQVSHRLTPKLQVYNVPSAGTQNRPH